MDELREIFAKLDALQSEKFHSYTGHYEFHNGWRIRGSPSGCQVGYTDEDADSGMVWYDWSGDFDWAFACCFRGRASPPPLVRLETFTAEGRLEKKARRSKRVKYPECIPSQELIDELEGIRGRTV